MTYEENLRKVAKSMQQANCTLIVNQHNLENVFIPAAYLSLRLQAEAAKNAYIQAFSEYGVHILPNNTDLIRHLIAHGLIPVTEVSQEGNCPDYSFKFRKCKPTNDNPIGHPAASLRMLPINERTFHCNLCGHDIKDPYNLIHI